MAIGDHEHLPESFAFRFDNFGQRLSQRLAGCLNHCLDALVDARACLWSQPHKHAKQLRHLWAILASGAGFPLSRLARGDFVAGHVGLDVPKQILDGAD